ncbi:MAG TPA: phage tail assembly protein [Candidatus Binataceae bacterium]|jgi:hypothetical protein|nr:phage tail assembly protein [Candidatus Binataceae bacterium]
MTEPIEIRLSDGRIATVRRPKGRDLRNAQRLAGKDATPYETSLAMLAQVATIDGAPIVMEDLDDFYADDINLMAEAAGSFLPSRSAPSPS